jgi:hypothetical protein
LCTLARLDRSGGEAVREIIRHRIRRSANTIKVGLQKGDKDDRYRLWGDDRLNEVAYFRLKEVVSLVQKLTLTNSGRARDAG